MSVLMFGVLIAFFVLILIFAVPISRRLLISKPIMIMYRKMMPALSKTEKEALEAGSVWWDGELFSGNPDWEKLLKIPKQELTAEEEAFVSGPCEKLCEMINDWQITCELKDLPKNVWQFIKEKGFFGMIIPKKYGGLGFSAYAHSCVIMKIASHSISTAVTVMVPNSLGPAELLLNYGTKKQQDYYLPRLASGKEIPCFALTEVEAGSDAGSMKAVGIVCEKEFEGKKTLGITLTWEKRYITLGPISTLLGLAFKLCDPNHLLGKEENLGITIALIPTDMSGIKIGERHDALNTPFMVGPNSGKNVFIPMEYIIGEKKQIGKGWQMLMSCLGVGRSISLPALSVGSVKMCARTMGAYARVRHQFKLPIGKFEGVKEKLAEIAGQTYICDSAREMTTAAIEEGAKPSVVSAIVKYHLTERARIVVNHAMDISGGSGICLGPKNILGNTYMALPIGITVEGANILTRSLIIFGQGVIRCHPFIQKELLAISNPDRKKGLRDFDKAIFGHVGFVVKNTFRTFWLGHTNSRGAKCPRKVGAGAVKYYKHLTRMSSAFALVSDVALCVLGGALKRKESLSARLSDILSEMYLTSAVLRRFSQDTSDNDYILMRWACETSLYKIQESFDEFLRNFPSRPIAWMLRRIIFPFGRSFAPPNDKLTFMVADTLLEPSELRDELISGIYTPSDTNNPIGLLEDALLKVVAAEPAEKRIKLAIRTKILKSKSTAINIREAVEKEIINKEEERLLIAANEAIKEVIRVDSF